MMPVMEQRHDFDILLSQEGACFVIVLTRLLAILSL